MLKACKENDKERVFAMTDKLNLNLDSETKSLEGKNLMKAIMKKWLPAADGMLGMIVDHLPSPDVAQRYRMDILYEGPEDDAAAIGNKHLYIRRMYTLSGSTYGEHPNLRTRPHSYNYM